VQSISSDISRPNETFVAAEIRMHEETRQRVAAEVEVPAGDRPALLIFSRPYFPGYRATIGAVSLPVNSFRGLAPAVEVPAGTSGLLVLNYRPWWLGLGGALTLITALVCCVALLARFIVKPAPDLIRPLNVRRPRAADREH